MTKEKTARLIPNAIQVCTDTEKVRDRESLRTGYLHEPKLGVVTTVDVSEEQGPNQHSLIRLVLVSHLQIFGSVHTR